MFEPLFERGDSWIVKTHVPVRRLTDKEIEVGGYDEELPEAHIFTEAVIDLGAMSPLHYIRAAYRHHGCTTFIAADGETYVIAHPYEDFVAEYLAWLNRPCIMPGKADG